jgi:hypothetical protein
LGFHFLGGQTRGFGVNIHLGRRKFGEHIQRHLGDSEHTPDRHGNGGGHNEPPLGNGIFEGLIEQGVKHLGQNR